MRYMYGWPRVPRRTEAQHPAHVAGVPKCQSVAGCGCAGSLHAPRVPPRRVVQPSPAPRRPLRLGVLLSCTGPEPAHASAGWSGGPRPGAACEAALNDRERVAGHRPTLVARPDPPAIARVALVVPFPAVRARSSWALISRRGTWCCARFVGAPARIASTSSPTQGTILPGPPDRSRRLPRVFPRRCRRAPDRWRAGGRGSAGWSTGHRDTAALRAAPKWHWPVDLRDPSPRGPRRRAGRRSWPRRRSIRAWSVPCPARQGQRCPPRSRSGAHGFLPHRPQTASSPPRQCGDHREPRRPASTSLHPSPPVRSCIGRAYAQETERFDRAQSSVARVSASLPKRSRTSSSSLVARPPGDPAAAPLLGTFAPVEVGHCTPMRVSPRGRSAVRHPKQRLRAVRMVSLAAWLLEVCDLVAREKSSEPKAQHHGADHPFDERMPESPGEGPRARSRARPATGASAPARTGPQRSAGPFARSRVDLRLWARA